MSFQIVNQSIFDTKAQAYVNTINCMGVMGAGIALEFKNRYPEMYENYKHQCINHTIRPGDCYIYDYNRLYLLGLAVKNDWRYWSTLEWIESCLKSLKLAILENDIKSVNLPLLGGMNGRRGPYGKVPGMTPAPDRNQLKELIQTDLEKFSDKFGVDIRLCIPEDAPKKVGLDLTQFLEMV